MQCREGMQVAEECSCTSGGVLVVGSKKLSSSLSYNMDFILAGWIPNESHENTTFLCQNTLLTIQQGRHEASGDIQNGGVGCSLRIKLPASFLHNVLSGKLLHPITLM